MMNRVALTKTLRAVGLCIGVEYRAPDWTFSGNGIIDDGDGALCPPGGSGELGINWVGVNPCYWKIVEQPKRFNGNGGNFYVLENPFQAIQ